MGTKVVLGGCWQMNTLESKMRENVASLGFENRHFAMVDVVSEWCELPLFFCEGVPIVTCAIF